MDDNEEVDVELTKVEIPGKQGNPSTFKYYHHMWSDPTKSDTDGDGLDDCCDKQPENSDIHSFVIYETDKTDVNIKNCEYSQRPEDYKNLCLSSEELLDLSLFADHSGRYLFDAPEDYLFLLWKDLATWTSYGDMQDVALEMIEHFKSGTGADYHNDILSQKISEHENTKMFTDSIEKIFEEYMRKYNGNLADFEYKQEDKDAEHDSFTKDVNLNVPRPVFNMFSDNFNGLGICVHDIYGFRVEVTSFQKCGNTYYYTLNFVIYDIFGLDGNDIKKQSSAGFEALFILQHYEKYRYKYKPFITYMEFDKTYSRSFE